MPSTADAATNTFDIHPRSVLDASQALFKALGEPKRTTYRWADLNLDHPVFGLVEHYRGHDYGAAGYTENNDRGDHLSIPCYSEEGHVFVLEISFHKGLMNVDRIDYPNGPAHIRDVLWKLLQDCETR